MRPLSPKPPFPVLQGKGALCRCGASHSASTRFLSRDAWSIDTQNPLELNRYVYAAANPVMFSDPSGYGVVTRSQIGAMVVGTAAYLDSLTYQINSLYTQAIVWLAQITNSPAFNQLANQLIDLGYRYAVEKALQDWADAHTQTQTRTQEQDTTQEDEEEDKPTFYYRAVGFVWRETEEIQSELSPYLHITGVGNIRDELNRAQEKYDKNKYNKNYWWLAGRKFEAERAIFYASHGMLILAQPRAAPDFSVRNFGIITNVEAKWTQTTYLHPDTQRSILSGVNNSKPGILLVDFSEITSGLEEGLKSIGGKPFTQ